MAGIADEGERLLGVRTLIAEETRIGMLIGVAIGLELGEELRGQTEHEAEGDQA